MINRMSACTPNDSGREPTKLANCLAFEGISPRDRHIPQANPKRERFADLEQRLAFVLDGL